MKNKIIVLGTRGIPNVQGGVETHCQRLYPAILQRAALNICVLARAPYVSFRRGAYRGVQIRALWAPRRRALEAIVHSLLAAGYCRLHGADLVHVHAIGPGLVVPLLRLMGLKVVFTHHGADYQRQKWGWLARRMLMLGERLAVRYANQVIVISAGIEALVRQRYGRGDAHLIPNGVCAPAPLPSQIAQDTLATYGLQAGRYLVAVGRFVEEKGLHDLIDAYRLSGVTLPLVLVGDADHPDAYSRRLKRLAHQTPNVVLTGFLRGEPLQAVFSQAALFVMPSYHEGLPIALLEAMSYSLPALVSDIPANQEVGLSPDAYFPRGNVAALAAALRERAALPREDYRSLLTRYDWQQIADQTLRVYHQANHSIG